MPQKLSRQKDASLLVCNVWSGEPSRPYAACIYFFEGGGGGGGGVHTILRCHDSFQKKMAFLNNHTSEGGKSIHFVKGPKIFFPKMLISSQ